jgi:uncharacterized protein (TIGR00297 family)
VSFQLVDPQLLVVGAVLAAAISLGGYATRSLSPGGAGGAFVVGTLVFGFGGPVWGLLLVFFFVSSSLLSEWRGNDKSEAAQRVERGGKRDLVQVVANGGIPAALALAQAALPGIDLLPAYVGAIAAVTADTWATEIGLTSSEPPRLITSGKTVTAGTSGGVTVLGSFASALAGIAVGVSAATLVFLEAVAVFRLPDVSGAPYLLVAPAAAVAGAAFDSWLGAVAQEVRRCDECNVDTELRVHTCGSATSHSRGIRWLNNDVVNLAASLVGAALAWLLYYTVWG